jgi:putative acetyltransferase
MMRFRTIAAQWASSAPPGRGAGAGIVSAMIVIARDDPTRADARQLLDEHLVDMFATSPAESVHALDHSALTAPNILFWTAREDGTLLGCGALKELAGHDGEIKSMRTSPEARGRGVAALVLSTIVTEARIRGLGTLYLETGSQEFFAPARRLYSRHGFTGCPPFAGYTVDPNSVFMQLALRERTSATGAVTVGEPQFTCQMESRG